MKIKPSDTATQRKKKLLDEGLRFAKKFGYRTMTLVEFGRFAKVSYGIIYIHFDNIKKFKHAVVQHAVETQDLEVIAEGLTAKDGSLRFIPENLRRCAAMHLLRKHT